MIIKYYNVYNIGNCSKIFWKKADQLIHKNTKYFDNGSPLEHYWSHELTIWEHSKKGEKRTYTIWSSPSLLVEAWLHLKSQMINDPSLEPETTISVGEIIQNLLEHNKILYHKKKHKVSTRIAWMQAQRFNTSLMAHQHSSTFSFLNIPKSNL